MDAGAAGAAAAAMSITEPMVFFPFAALDFLGAMEERDNACVREGTCVREVWRKKMKREQKEQMRYGPLAFIIERG